MSSIKWKNELGFYRAEKKPFNKYKPSNKKLIELLQIYDELPFTISLLKFSKTMPILSGNGELLSFNIYFYFNVMLMWFNEMKFNVTIGI